MPKSTRIVYLHKMAHKVGRLLKELGQEALSELIRKDEKVVVNLVVQSADNYLQLHNRADIADHQRAGYPRIDDDNMTTGAEIEGAILAPHQVVERIRKADEKEASKPKPAKRAKRAAKTTTK